MDSELVRHCIDNIRIKATNNRSTRQQRDQRWTELEMKRN